MKKWISLILAVVTICVLLPGCGSEAAGGVEGTPEEIIAKIYKAHKEMELPLVGMDVDLSDLLAVESYTGLKSADKLSALSISEAMMGQPYSLVVARVKNAKDAAAVAKEMFEKVDGRKWICVEADTRTAAYSGDVVMFFMINSEFSEDATTATMADAFKSVCGGNVTFIG